MSRRRENPLGRIVRAGVSRKRVQTLVMTLTTMTAVTASVLASGLLLDSQGHPTGRYSILGCVDRSRSTKVLYNAGDHTLQYGPWM